MSIDWKNGAKEYFIAQLTELDERRQELLDDYYPYLSRAYERRAMEQLLDRYIERLEQLIQVGSGQNDAFETIVLIGSQVKVYYTEFQVHETYTICFPEQTDPDKGWISFTSPIGSQLLLSSVSDTVRLSIPAGHSEVIIQEITVQPTETNTA